MKEKYIEGVGRVIPVLIEDEMRTAYIDYSMSVIVSRAIPDVRDGLKPVQRRILYAMNELGLQYNRPYKKCARIVGEVLGKYHPHGDSSVYEALVRMAQDWVMRYPLVDGQGNFGSIDGDAPAAMRYTEARLTKISAEMLRYIDSDTVDFRPNFDDTLEEPEVLPAHIPNLIVNGSSGIAVGMATSIPPHNIKEVCNAIIALLDNPNMTIEELMQYIPGPDFPTGGNIIGRDGIISAYTTGKGKVIVRGVAEIKTKKSGQNQIIITQIPYNVNKAEMIVEIAKMVNEKKLEGISDIRDESNKEGIRIVIDIKRDANPEIVLNNLYKHTQLQTTFNIIMIALVNGQPKLMNLKELLQHYIDFRYEILRRRLNFELKKLREKAHILEGLIKVLSDIDRAISLIKNSRTVEEAQNKLMAEFALSEEQAKAVLDMRLQRLTSLEIEKIKNEYNEVMQKIAENESVLADPNLQREVIKKEIEQIRDEYADQRRTNIIEGTTEFKMEEVIEDVPVFVVISKNGYIKRIPEKLFRTQDRGGKSSNVSNSSDEDFATTIIHATNHKTIVFFSSRGKCYFKKVYEIPEGTPSWRGRSLNNFLALSEDEKIADCIILPDHKDTSFLNSHFCFFITRKGVVKRVCLSEFANAKTRGIKAISLDESDALLNVHLTNGKSKILIVSSSARSILINEDEVRVMGRNAYGVKGIKLSTNEHVVSSLSLKEETTHILVITEKGYGKLIPIEEFRLQKRGGTGIKITQISKQTGNIAYVVPATINDILLITTRNGKSLRVPVQQISMGSRYARGSPLIKLDEGDTVSAAEIISKPISSNGTYN